MASVYENGLNLNAQALTILDRIRHYERQLNDVFTDRMPIIIVWALCLLAQTYVCRMSYLSDVGQSGAYLHGWVFTGFLIVFVALSVKQVALDVIQFVECWIGRNQARIELALINKRIARIETLDAFRARQHANRY